MTHPYGLACDTFASQLPAVGGSDDGATGAAAAASTPQASPRLIQASRSPTGALPRWRAISASRATSSAPRPSAAKRVAAWCKSPVAPAARSASSRVEGVTVTPPSIDEQLLHACATMRTVPLGSHRCPQRQPAYTRRRRRRSLRTIRTRPHMMTTTMMVLVLVQTVRTNADVVRSVRSPLPRLCSACSQARCPQRVRSGCSQRSPGAYASGRGRSRGSARTCDAARRRMVCRSVSRVGPRALQVSAWR